MKCVQCGNQVEVKDGQFMKNGMLMGSIPRHDFKCRECLVAIDNTSKDPGGEVAPPTDW